MADRARAPLISLPQRARKPDVDAAARMSALGPATLGSNAMRLAVLQALGRVLPLCFPPPAILQVTKASVPYSSVERQMRQETLSMLAVVLAPVSLVLCALANVAGRLPFLTQSAGACTRTAHTPARRRLTPGGRLSATGKACNDRGPF